MGVFLDIQGAFDNILTESIVKGMRAKNIDNAIINWYKQFLQNRSVNIQHKGCNITRYLTKGTPQGGVLSPVVWNLGFDSFLKQYPDTGKVKVVGFADDAALVCTATKPDVAQREMQKAVDKAE